MVYWDNDENLKLLKIYLMVLQEQHQLLSWCCIGWVPRTEWPHINQWFVKYRLGMTTVPEPMNPMVRWVTTSSNTTERYVRIFIQLINLYYLINEMLHHYTRVHQRRYITLTFSCGYCFHRNSKELVVYFSHLWMLWPNWSL
jgi:hypothetical protein